MNGATVSMFVIGAVIALVIALVVGAEIVTQTQSLVTQGAVEGTCTQSGTNPDGPLSPDCTTDTLGLAATVVEFIPVLYFVGLFAIPAAIGFAAYKRFTAQPQRCRAERKFGPVSVGLSLLIQS